MYRYANRGPPRNYGYDSREDRRPSPRLNDNRRLRTFNPPAREMYNESSFYEQKKQRRNDERPSYNQAPRADMTFRRQNPTTGYYSAVPRPLARLTVRAKIDRATGRPLKRGESDAYRLEVNEIPINPAGNATETVNVPCITLLDYHRITPTEISQRRGCIPVALADTIMRHLLTCQNEDGKFVVSDLPENTQFKCPKTGKIVEISKLSFPEVKSEDGDVSGCRQLRSYVSVLKKDEYKSNDPVEMIELRDTLIRSLVRFLNDVALRYRNIKDEMMIPALYSHSGERRFYYDLRRTRWGLRLHVSQVTDLHRNVIGIPLESLVSFRNRLNHVISFLKLDNNILGGKTASGDEENTSSAKTKTTGTPKRTPVRRLNNKLRSGGVRQTRNRKSASNGEKLEKTTESGTGNSADENESSSSPVTPRSHEENEKEEEEPVVTAVNDSEDKDAITVSSGGSSSTEANSSSVTTTSGDTEEDQLSDNVAHLNTDANLKPCDMVAPAALITTA